MRLLPPDKPETGWVPYLWLVYIVGFLAYPFLAHAGPGTFALTFLGAAAFFVLYFWGYWLDGVRVLWSAGGITLLALLYSPWNPGASTLWVYAAATLCKAGRPRIALRWLGVLLALLALESWLARLSPWVWVSAGLFSLIVGGATLQQEQVRRSHARLRQAQEEVERLAQVAERERIARDLHDLLGHTLSLITLKAELAGKLLAREPRDLEAVRREIGDLERISREALKEVRNAVTGYRAEDLRAELARARMALDAADVAFAAPPGSEVPVDLTPAEESALAFALREAVTNVVRHARAKSCRVGIAAAREGVRLEVVDDGRGAPKEPAPEGSGLAGMRERLGALGGSVVREGGATGTRLTIFLPRGGRPRPGGAALPALPTLPPEPVPNPG
jgi:two-component system, NarL family, sensor histidine kinase DesK